MRAPSLLLSRRGLLTLTLAAAVGLTAAGPAAAQDGRVPAPELTGTGWLGTSKPLSLKDLRGKIVVLDFWTLC